jgi:hypothetical protein
MPNLHVRVERDRSPEADANPWPYQLARARKLHGLVASLGLDVADWGDTDDETTPHELVELHLSLNDPAVIAALLAAFKVWQQRDKMTVKVSRGDGTWVSLTNAASADLKRVLQVLGLGASRTDPARSRASSTCRRGRRVGPRS